MGLINKTTFLGVEIEVENAPELYDKTPAYWDIKGDGSLRAGGVELVFKQPYKGLKAENAIKEAYEELLHKKIKTSPRTAIHVHIDVRDMTVLQLKILCLTYALVEEPLFEWVGDYRKGNNFCLPWFEAEADIETISDVLHSEAHNFAIKARNIHRYSALNLNALYRFGSVEFRHLRTTLDKERVYKWINMLLCIKSFAISREGLTGMELLTHFSAIGAKRFLHQVFGDFAEELDHNAIHLGLILAHDLLRREQKVSDSLFFAHKMPVGTFEGFTRYMENKNKRV